jgi:hypothetical protein
MKSLLPAKELLNITTRINIFLITRMSLSICREANYGHGEV